MALVFLLPFGTGAQAGEKPIVGWLENVKITPGNLKIKAKLDTGALTSSLHVIHCEEFERQGEKWIRFSLTSRQGGTTVLERKVVRKARIKAHGRESDKRWVIRLGICLGNVFKEAEVNLRDRSGFNYPMLIGRSFLRGSFVIDPALEFSVEPQCPGVTDP